MVGGLRTVTGKRLGDTSTKSLVGGLRAAAGKRPGDTLTKRRKCSCRLQRGTGCVSIFFAGILGLTKKRSRDGGGGVCEVMDPIPVMATTLAIYRLGLPLSVPHLQCHVPKPQTLMQLLKCSFLGHFSRPFTAWIPQLTWPMEPIDPDPVLKSL